MDENTIQLYIELDGIKPKIWRRFVVGDMISFDRLHRAIQAVMGWEDSHLYFKSAKQKFNLP
jgi:Plasmid pRiA4b ORF-3-like protein